MKTIAELKFGAIARAEDIAGVKCDCILNVGNGSTVILEISRESTLAKLRIDLAKFNVIRPHYFQRNIFPICYFITVEDPTPALITSAKENHVQALSFTQFFDSMVGLNKYATARLLKPFGCAIDLYSGAPDQNEYVPVEYISSEGKPYTTESIATELIAGRTLVLIGDYGSGKSRCIQQVYQAIRAQYDKYYRNPLAINLRDNWGLKRAQEILTRHFTDLGLESTLEQALKVAPSAATIYLLDGFDEIGAQTWSDDPTKLVEIRNQSLIGVKDLILQAHGGVLITGREHYFNDDAELMTCLGLDRKNPIFLRCNQELTNGQFSQLLNRAPKSLPGWMPKKPLIATIIRDIESEAFDQLLATSAGEIEFWDLLITSFCEREARINPILDSVIIRDLYTKIGRLSRNTATSLGPISIKQINDAFEETTGRPPTDESAIVLQRLPGLSRIGAESLDRQFAEKFILEGLKAEDVIEVFLHNSTATLSEAWKNPVEDFGAYYIATHLQRTNQVVSATAFTKRNLETANKVAISDIICALLKIEEPEIDYTNHQLSNGKFSSIALSESGIKNLSLKDCIIDNLDIMDTAAGKITISDSVILKISNVTSEASLPDWISGCAIESFQELNTLSNIKNAGLSLSQTFLLSSLRKLFLQPGGGRKESSMYKGYGDSTSKKVCERVISLLLKEGFCQQYRGSNGPIYVPNRSLTGRVHSIVGQATTSKDPLWIAATKLSGSV